MDQDAETTQHRPTSQTSLVDWLFRSRETGKIVIVQIPNLPLAIYLVTTATRLAFHPAGTAGQAVSLITGVALAWWSIDEIARGVNPFRRALGAVVLIGLVASLLLR
jgi:hypothetical protein